MANGLPYAIAAQVAYPDRQCVAFVGDGGFSMLMAEFATAVKYQLPIKVVIVKNNTLGQIKWEQMVFLGNPEYGCELQPIDFAAFARACGGDGLHASTIRQQCGGVLDAGARARRARSSSRRWSIRSSRRCRRRSASSRPRSSRSRSRREPNRNKIALTCSRTRCASWCSTRRRSDRSEPQLFGCRDPDGILVGPLSLSRRLTAINAGTVVAAPMVTSVNPMAFRRGSGIFFESSKPMPAPSAARVATTKPNIGMLRTTVFMTNLQRDTGCVCKRCALVRPYSWNPSFSGSSSST